MPTIPRKVGQMVEFTAHGNRFRLKKCSQTTYYLDCPLRSPHCRWGDRKQIAEDVAHCVEWGTLPPAAVNTMY